MADVFISYAREDSDQAERLARALGEEGLDVWWDIESIRSSEGISESIHAALNNARRVLVLWSSRSVSSRWVDAEALYAWEKGKLHSVWLAEGTPVRVPFNASHAISLAGWDGNRDSAEFRRLVTDIRGLAARSAEDVAATGSSAKGVSGGAEKFVSKGQWRTLAHILGLAAPTLFVSVIALVLMQWHKPTRIELELTVDRIALRVASDPTDGGLATLINYGEMRSIGADRVARVSFTPETLEIADEARFDLKSDLFPEDAWRPFAVKDDLVLEPVSDSPDITAAVSLQSMDNEIPGLIKLVRVNVGAEVVMELGKEEDGDQPWLTLVLDEIPARTDVVFAAPFLMMADYMRLLGAEGPTVSSDSLSLRASSDSNTAISVLGSDRGLVLQLVPAGSVTALLGDSYIPVDTVDFTRQGSAGERLSSLVGEGSLAYPDFPFKEPLKIAANEFISLTGLEKARIASLGVANMHERAGLKLTLDAVARVMRIGTPEHPRDVRLTWFDWLWHQPMLRIFFAIVVWFFPTTLAGYKLWQELRSRVAMY